jgi:hypothetical protein
MLLINNRRSRSSPQNGFHGQIEYCFKTDTYPFSNCVARLQRRSALLRDVLQHELVAANVETSFDDGDFQYFTDGHDSGALNGMSGRHQINADRFHWLEQNQRNHKQRERR